MRCALDDIFWQQLPQGLIRLTSFNDSSDTVIRNSMPRGDSVTHICHIAVHVSQETVDSLPFVEVNIGISMLDISYGALKLTKQFLTKEYRKFPIANKKFTEIQRVSPVPAFLKLLKMPNLKQTLCEKPDPAETCGSCLNFSIESHVLR
jgi:hypothetical protein